MSRLLRWGFEKRSNPETQVTAKKPGLLRKALILTILTGSLLLAACGKTAGGPQVIAERTEAGQTTDGALTGAEESVSRPADGILEMTAPPARYEAKVETDKIQVVCDAEVSVPDTDLLPVYSVENQPYTEEELAAYRDLLAKEIGTEWTAAPEIGEGCWESRDGRYHLDTHTGDGNSGGILPMVWMKSTSYSRFYYRNSAKEAAELAGMTEAELAAAVPQAEAAQDLLKKLTGNDMDLISSKWWIAELKDSSDPQLGVVYSFCRPFPDIRLPENGRVLLGTGTGPANFQYAEVTYGLDGTLWEVRHIGREAISPIKNGESFLLPFAAISEIFEQYCRAYFDEEGHSERSNGSVQLRVTRAALEYRFVSKAAGRDTPISGTLVPVWNFYGTAYAEYWLDGKKQIDDASFYAGQEYLLVSINAEDGSVYGN